MRCFRSQGKIQNVSVYKRSAGRSKVDEEKGDVGKKRNRRKEMLNCQPNKLKPKKQLFSKLNQSTQQIMHCAAIKKQLKSAYTKLRTRIHTSHSSTLHLLCPRMKKTYTHKSKKCDAFINTLQKQNNHTINKSKQETKEKFNLMNNTTQHRHNHPCKVNKVPMKFNASNYHIAQPKSPMVKTYFKES